MAVIDLTHDLKIKLLQAVQCGKLDLSIFDKLGDKMTIEEIHAEILRLEKLDYDEVELVKRLEYCKHKISPREFYEWYADHHKLNKADFLRLCGL